MIGSIRPSDDAAAAPSVMPHAAAVGLDAVGSDAGVVPSGTGPPGGRRAGKPRLRRRLVVWSAGAAALLAAGGLFFLITLWTWVLQPRSVGVTDPGEADAVALFLGGRGERSMAARDLLALGVADVLVIPNGTALRGPGLRRLCDQRSPDLEVVCPPTDRQDTGGEARAIGALAQAEGWDRVVLVTSDYHVGRARLRLERCFDGEVAAIAAPDRLGRREEAGRLLREWFGHIEARTIERSC